MSEALLEKSCEPCRGGIPPMSESQAQAMMAQLPGWVLGEGGTRLSRRFEFPNFRDALAFVVQIGALAEVQDHHPDIQFGWGYVEVLWYSHKINGLHENDFIMAARTSELIN